MRLNNKTIDRTLTYIEDEHKYYQNKQQENKMADSNFRPLRSFHKLGRDIGPSADLLPKVLQGVRPIRSSKSFVVITRYIQRSALFSIFSIVHAYIGGQLPVQWRPRRSR